MVQILLCESDKLRPKDFKKADSAKVRAGDAVEAVVHLVDDDDLMGGRGG